MAWTTPGTATAGSVLTASWLNTNVRDNTNALSRGVVAKVANTADFTCNVGSFTDVTSCTVTWTAESDRLYVVVFDTYAQKNTNAGNLLVRIVDGSGNLKQDRAISFPNISYPFAAVHMDLYETGLSGSITRKVQAQSSTAGCTLPASATFPRHLYVVDMGLA